MKIGEYATPDSNLKAWTKDKLAWAAGVMDGEGCTHNSTSNRRGEMLIQVAQSSSGEVPEMLIRLYDLFGGSIYHIPSRKDRRPFFHWRVRGEERVQAVIAAMWPWLGTEKRVQATKALKNWRERWD